MNPWIIEISGSETISEKVQLRNMLGAKYIK